MAVNSQEGKQERRIQLKRRIKRIVGYKLDMTSHTHIHTHTHARMREREREREREERREKKKMMMMTRVIRLDILVINISKWGRWKRVDYVNATTYIKESIEKYCT